MQPVIRDNSASYPQRTGNEYRPKCGEGLRLSIVKLGWHIPVVKKTCGWQVNMCDRSLTRDLPERLRDDVAHNKALHKSKVYLYFIECQLN